MRCIAVFVGINHASAVSSVAVCVQSIIWVVAGHNVTVTKF